jgi:hypothetical protein
MARREFARLVEATIAELRAAASRTEHSIRRLLRPLIGNLMEWPELERAARAENERLGTPLSSDDITAILRQEVMDHANRFYAVRRG